MEGGRTVGEGVMARSKRVARRTARSRGASRDGQGATGLVGRITQFEVANGLPHDLLSIGLGVLAVALLTWPLRAGARAIRRMSRG